MDDEFGGVRSENIIQQEKESGAYFNSQHKIRIKCWKHAHTFFFFFSNFKFSSSEINIKKNGHDVCPTTTTRRKWSPFLVDKPPNQTANGAIECRNSMQ